MYLDKTHNLLGHLLMFNLFCSYLTLVWSSNLRDYDEVLDKTYQIFARAQHKSQWLRVKFTTCSVFNSVLELPRWHARQTFALSINCGFPNHSSLWGNFYCLVGTVYLYICPRSPAEVGRKSKN